ncbi:MAG: secretion activator protein [Desulfobacterales bacterium]|nr:secretion activator protein [Desulfobacterales bacterium]
MSDFDKAFERTIKFEGGLSCHKDDKGGITKFGISSSSYPNLDITNLTIDKAKEIYRKDFWNKLKLDQIQFPLNALIFDFTVHSGQNRAVSLLQEILSISKDGIIGHTTLQAIKNKSEQNLKGLCIEYQHKRTLFILNLILSKQSYWDSFGRGWINRMVQSSNWIEQQFIYVTS